MTLPFPTVDLLGMELTSIDMEQLLEHMFGALSAGRGGWLVTANLDFLRRYVREPATRRIYEDADLRVADGMPLIWASWLRGTPLPERVAGSSIVEPLCQRAAREGRSVYLLGGDPAANEVAARKLVSDHPGLRIAGRSSPMLSAVPTPEQLTPMGEQLAGTRPDFVLVAFGSPKQEHVISALRAVLPHAWWIGVGISLSFVAGHVQRAPPLVQRLGLEWAHRLAQEPKRLSRRYVLEDIPFAFEMFGRIAHARLSAYRPRQNRRP